MPLRSPAEVAPGSPPPPDDLPTPSRRAPRLAILGSRGIPARYGGFETFAEELSSRLAEQGYDVTVFCEGRRGVRPATHRGVRLEYVAAHGPRSLRTLWYDVVSLWRARRGYDVVYMLGYGAGPFLFVPRLFGRVLWVNMDGIEWRRCKWSPLARLWLRLAESVACRAATQLIFDNRAVAQEVGGRHPRSAPHRVIEYGGECVRESPGSEEADAVLARFGLEPDGYYLVVGRFERENQILETVRAFAGSETVRSLCIVANAEVGTRYVRRTMRHAGERVRFLGSVYDPTALRVLRTHCHAYVHGHSAGGTNLSLLEAMGCANLILAHDNPFNREVLGDAGLFYADAAALTERIGECEALDAETRDRLRFRGRDRIATHYNWPRIAARYAEALPDLPPRPAEETRPRAAG